MDRVHIANGRFLWYFEPWDMEGADVLQFSAVYDLNGRRLPEFSWDGPGTIHPARGGKRRVVLGDPYRDTQLHEVLIDDEPAPEAEDYYQGYRKGWFAKRRPKTPKRASSWYVDGLRDGYAARRS